MHVTRGGTRREEILEEEKGREKRVSREEVVEEDERRREKRIRRCTREDCRRRTEDVEKEEAGGVKNKSPVGRGAVQDGPKLFGTTPRAEGSSSARGNQVPLECDRPREKQNKFLCSRPSLLSPFFSALVRFAPRSSSPSPPPVSRPPREKH